MPTLKLSSNVVLFLLGSTALAWACATHSASEIAAAIENSPKANAAMKATACTWGGAAKAESGGNTCSSNGHNFGVLQLNEGNLNGVSPKSYLGMDLQHQVDLWAQNTGGNFSTGYSTLSNNLGGSISGTTVTPGMLAACYQFGPAICQNDVAFMQSHGGACPSAGNGGININSLPKRKLGLANLDGNGQSICSWGKVINQKIAQNAASCQNKCNGQGGGVPSPQQAPGDIQTETL